jgi:homoserine dehydrogenase
VSRYYVRIEAVDRPGVLARIAGALGEHGVGIESITQRAAETGEASVPVILWTHEVKESSVRDALADIDALVDVTERSSLIRIEEDL